MCARGERAPSCSINQAGPAAALSGGPLGQVVLLLGRPATHPPAPRLGAPTVLLATRRPAFGVGPGARGSVRYNAPIDLSPRQVSFRRPNRRGSVKMSAPQLLAVSRRRTRRSELNLKLAHDSCCSPPAFGFPRKPPSRERPLPRFFGVPSPGKFEAMLGTLLMTSLEPRSRSQRRWLAG